MLSIQRGECSCDEKAWVFTRSRTKSHDLRIMSGSISSSFKGQLQIKIEKESSWLITLELIVQWRAETWCYRFYQSLWALTNQSTQHKTFFFLGCGKLFWKVQQKETKKTKYMTRTTYRELWTDDRQSGDKLFELTQDDSLSESINIYFLSRETNNQIPWLTLERLSLKAVDVWWRIPDWRFYWFPQTCLWNFRCQYTKHKWLKE